MKKIRMPKNARKRALRRYELDAAKEYKQAMARRDGAAGAASPVRRIDPNSPEGQAILAALHCSPDDTVS